MVPFGLTLIIGFLGFYLLLVLLLYLFQTRLIYFPVRQFAGDPGTLGLTYQEVNFPAEDGINLYAWYVPVENSSRILLFCHGNAGNISHRLESIRLFHHLDLNIFIFDYRGFGLSGGKPTEAGTYRDVAGAWAYIRNELGYEAQEIILFGRSLGASIAARLAAQENPLALILESPFQSLASVAARHYPILPVRWLLRHPYNTWQSVAKVACPIMIIHSEEDEMIPYAQGQALYELAGQPKSFLSIRGGHNDGFLLSEHIYQQGIAEFLQTI